METTVPPRLIPAEGRKFGLTVGTALLALGSYLFWRGDRISGVTIGIVGGLLVLGGIAIPSSLGSVYRAWIFLARAMSRFTTPVFMAIIYFGVITGIGIGMRLTGRNAIARKTDGNSYWIPRKGNILPYNPMDRQF